MKTSQTQRSEKPGKYDALEQRGDVAAAYRELFGKALFTLDPSVSVHGRFYMN
jgi:hypothetical protein